MIPVSLDFLDKVRPMLDLTNTKMQVKTSVTKVNGLHGN